MTRSLATLVDDDAQAFAAVVAGLPGAGLPWLQRAREVGRAAFAATGWPTKKTEAWKYTDLRPLHAVDFVPAATLGEPASLDRAPGVLPAADVAARLVFVDGQFRPALSTTSALPDGVRLEDLSAALSHDAALRHDAGGLGDALPADPADLVDRPLLALNTALMDGGWVLRVGRGVAVDRPIEIVTVTGLADRPVAAHPRALVVLEAQASVDLIEHSVGLGAGAAFTNASLDIRVGAGARLRHYRVQADSLEAFAVSTVLATVDRDATYETFGLATGARLSRIEARVRLDGPGASCAVNGAYLMAGRQHVDNTTEIEHRAPHTTSREVFKGVLDDESRGVFQGRIVVHRHAQQIVGHQLSKALLLSDRAEIDAKPELRIWADDVKCSHGAAAGALDRQALFYLRSRGLDEAAARSLLIEAFLAEALDEVSNREVADAMTNGVKEWMANRAKPSA